MQSLKKYYFSKQKTLPPNTFIGGVGATITSASSLATKLGISSSRITDFAIDGGNNVSCNISGSYIIPNNGFGIDGYITYYNDNDNLVSDVASFAFKNNALGTSKLRRLTLNGIVNLTGGDIINTALVEELYLENCTSIVDASLRSINAAGFNSKMYCCIPNCTSLGSSSGNNGVFSNALAAGSIIICHPSLATNNSGNPDGDIQDAISQGAIIRYKNNNTSPNPITDLSAGTIYNSAVQLNFTTPTGSTNAIDYYEVYINRVFNGKYVSNPYALGLKKNTNYNITVKAVDIFYNKSISNLLNVTTSNYSYQTETTSLITATSYTTEQQKESADILINGLKTNSLWSKIQAGWLFKGTTMAMQKYNIKNPVDSDAAFRLVFSGSGTYSDLGFQCNGSNSFADTKINASTLNCYNVGLTIVSGTNNSQTSKYEIGLYQGSPACGFLLGVREGSGNNTTGASAGSPNGYVQASGINDAKGILSFVATSNSNRKLFKNGISISSSSTIASSVNPNMNLFIGGLNNQGSPNNYSTQRIQIALIHEGLTDAEVATLHSIIDISETIAGRKTW